tara:strand:- start:12460 stop:13431 length:972 start_codon:yes stop_codon:yes gene_type:complete
MTINSKPSHISHTQIILIFSFIFCLVVGSGFYGYGNDWYAAYFKPNLTWNTWYRDQLGWRIATLSIYNFHLGVYLTTFILSVSSGFLLERVFRIKKINSIAYFCLLFLIVIHTWPIIMSTSNAMRQGICMSFIFLFISALMEKKIFLAFICILFATFTHTSGPFYLILYFAMLLVLFGGKFFLNPNLKLIFYFLSGLILSIIIFYLLSKYVPIQNETRIIHGDYRLPFLIINFSFITLLTYENKLLLNRPTNLFIYLFSFIAPVLFFMGYNWQYERLCMMMLIPYILFFGTYLKNIYAVGYYLISFGLLLSLTLITGMYVSLK